MRKVRMLLTLVMALVMMFAMTITAAATDEGLDAPSSGTGAKIEVLNADDATLTYDQVIVANRKTVTGWEIVDKFKPLFAGFDTSDADTQKDIDALVKAATEAEILSKLGDVGATKPFSNPLTVKEPGLYLINGTEENFDYSPMLVYVSAKDIAEGKTLQVKAKKTPTLVVKKLVNENDDKAVEYGAEIPYDVEVTIPYSPKGEEASFVINDELSGGVFKTAEGATTTEVTITIEALNYTETRQIAATENGTKLTIDISDLIIHSDDPEEDNKYAGYKAVISYAAIADGTLPAVNNKAYIGDKPETGTTVTSWTGTLKITKMNEADANEPEYLVGAEFVIIKKVNDVTSYAVIEDGKLAGWVATEEEATKLVTDENGEASADGFSPDEKYSFHEVLAPEGYALNPHDEEPEWKEIKDNGKIVSYLGEATMHDTKLSELPYTGGKGTAAFTGFGVLLMSVAAGLYFANKKNKSIK
ncbi:LPXTG-motif cell wall anchor domain-containing protein/fimbrial isopeptide formation D2 domain-containing protein [Pseudobutyrivibrio sp. UC1225]|uniref:isopeptide-forming domain-containing fimbrial protein n=1 Tax=Pseudobutyrivibrio sp. UC1225 TaxID=1798185 RepID=UPI0008E0B0F5|nr:SpaA isopeptide-forming pilin-related protein [Pseudobutyrivibrio sp. UC1225]SFN86173.1 LPXTG-motif cell wall anchor domain-containing protein/fimbrial isopeptide formation D2 domain-containing protein [Pseudobutyrivibrio sp. UC1225]